MIVSNCYRYFLLQRSANGSCQKPRKIVPGMDGRPTIQPNLIEEGFPLVRPNWDFERAEGKQCLRVYHQTLMAGLRVAAKKPTKLAKINSVRQEPNESPAAFLERIMEALNSIPLWTHRQMSHERQLY